MKVSILGRDLLGIFYLYVEPPEDNVGNKQDSRWIRVTDPYYLDNTGPTVWVSADEWELWGVPSKTHEVEIIYEECESGIKSEKTEYLLLKKNAIPSFGSTDGEICQMREKGSANDEIFEVRYKNTYGNILYMVESTGR